MKIGIIKNLEELDTIRTSWEEWQDHPNVDFAQFKMICHLRPEVDSPCVTVVEGNGQLGALLAGRLERTQFSPPIGYFRPVRISAKVLTILHKGVLGKMDDQLAKISVKYLWSMLVSGMADVIEFQYLSEDSPLLNALQIHSSGWFCDKKPRWSIHWDMEIPSGGSFIEHKVRAKHRTGFRKRERELETAFPGKVSWRWLNRFDDIPALCARLEEVAARAYQRGLGTGFIDNEEYRQRLSLFASRGQLRVQLLEIDGKVRAFWFGYLYQDVFHLSETGYDPDLSKYEVGTLMFIRLNDELIKEGVRKLDFGIGDALYKRRFGDRSWREGTVWLFAPTAKGLVLRSTMGLFSTVDKFGRNAIQTLGVLDRIKTGWRRRLAPGKSSGEPE